MESVLENLGVKLISKEQESLMRILLSEEETRKFISVLEASYELAR